MKSIPSKEDFPKGILLDVGCRDRKQPNFVGIDWRNRPGVDIVWDLEKFPYPIESGICHTIKCAHVIEHIKPWLVFPFMNELWRMLKVGGQLCISAPFGCYSAGWMQDPSHCTHITDRTFQYFDPKYTLYNYHRPRPWDISFCSYKLSENIEAIMIKMDAGKIDLADKAIELGAIQKQNELNAFLTFLMSASLDTVVEIGTAGGGVFYALCQMANDGATIVSIDLPGGSFGGGYSLEMQKRFETYGKPNQRLNFLRLDSHAGETKNKLKGILGNRKIDLLFIDGDHTYEGVRKDWEMYSPMVRSGGIVTFHDIVLHPHIPECQVDKFWNEIKAKHKHYEFIDPSGLPSPMPAVTPADPSAYTWNDVSWAGIGVIVK